MYSDEMRPVVLTGDGSDGFPSEVEFTQQMEDYLLGLNPKKRAKALMSQDMYSTILSVLLEPHSTTFATAQFRFWSKRMFRLVSTAQANIVTHENRPVAVREQIYSILVGCHGDASHGGRDKTSAQVRRYYSWIPKELVSRFVKMCPHCIAKRKAQRPFLHDTLFPTNSSSRAAYSTLLAPAPLAVPKNHFLEANFEDPVDYEVTSGNAPDSSYEYNFQSYPAATDHSQTYLQYSFSTSQAHSAPLAPIPGDPAPSQLEKYLYGQANLDVADQGGDYDQHGGEQGDSREIDYSVPSHGWVAPAEYPKAGSHLDYTTYTLPPPISFSSSEGQDEPAEEDEWNSSPTRILQQYRLPKAMEHDTTQYSEGVYTEGMPVNEESQYSRRSAKPPPLELGRSSNLYQADAVMGQHQAQATNNHLSVDYRPHGSHSAPPQASSFYNYRSNGDGLLPSPGPLSACSSTSSLSTHSYQSQDSTTSDSSYLSDCNSLASALGSFPLTPNGSGSHGGEVTSWDRSGQELAEAIQNLLSTPTPDILVSRDSDSARKDRERTRTRTISCGTPLPLRLEVAATGVERRRASMLPFESRKSSSPKKEECRYTPY